jgi:hypothetical protein
MEPSMPKKIRCKTCGLLCTGKKGLKQHTQNKHAKPTLPFLPCSMYSGLPPTYVQHKTATPFVPTEDLQQPDVDYFDGDFEMRLRR